MKMLSCKNQCNWRALFFEGSDPRRFAMPQANWPLLPVSFTIYRILLALYQLTLLLLVFTFWGTPPLYSKVDSKAKWFIFVSNWSFLLLTIYCVWSAIVVLYWNVRGKKIHKQNYGNGKNNMEMNENYGGHSDDDDGADATEMPFYTPWYFKLTWLLQVVACSTELFVTILYWVLDYDPGEDAFNFFTINVHGVGLFLIILDFMLVANPFRYLHFVYVCAYAFLYFLFTYIYSLCGGLDPHGNTYIYKGYLDWNDSPMKTIVVAIVGVTIMCPILHLIFLLLLLIRLSFGKCCKACRSFETSAHAVY